MLARSRIPPVVMKRGTTKAEDVAGVNVEVARATGAMVVRPTAETPQALVGGAAAAGMAAATTTLPITASDPATLTALLRIRFTSVPFIGDCDCVVPAAGGAGAAAVPTLACYCGSDIAHSG